MSPEYSMMLLSESLVRLLQLWDEGAISLTQHLTQDRIPMILVQILNRILMDQNSDGSWGLLEVSAYAISTLVVLSSLPFVDLCRIEIENAITTGRKFLTTSNWSEPQYIWIEKVTYGSETLVRAYCLAALKCQPLNYEWKSVSNLVPNVSKINELSKFYGRIPKFSGAGWKIKASIIEASFYLPRLKAARLEIFPEQDAAKDAYLDHIPIAWILTNHWEAISMTSGILWDMMELSLLDFLVDEYMESVVVRCREGELRLLEDAIWLMCSTKSPKQTDLKRKFKDRNLTDESLEDDKTRTSFRGRSSEPGKGMVTPPFANSPPRLDFLKEIEAVLSKYVNFILEHPRVAHVGSSEKHTLHEELQLFLLAHITQIRDNSRLELQESQCFLTPRSSYHKWVHTTASKHISAPLSFAFYTCLLGSPKDEAFPVYCGFTTAYEKYLAVELSSHLALTSRMYNDFASLTRDRTEGNLNSVNFPEFHAAREETEHGGGRKKDLLKLAKYERQCMLLTAKILEENFKSRVVGGGKMADAIRLFVSVTEVFADMYILKDLTNIIK